MKITCCKVNKSVASIVAAGSFDAEKRRRMYQRRREERAQANNALMDAIKNESDPTEQIQIIFDKYVPRSGTAKNLGGEYARAMMKIIYRWYNDGDKFYEGYGLETCGNAAQLLFNDIPGADELMYDIAETQRDEDEWYEDQIAKLASLVVNHVVNHPEVFSEPAVDMYTVNPVNIQEMEPEYSYEPDLSGDLELYIENDCIDWDDVENFLEELCSTYGGNVSSWARDAFIIESLNRDEYNQWEEMFSRELIGYLDELESEYPNYGEEDEEYDEDEYDNGY